MPQHRRSEVLPQRLICKVRASEEHPFFGRLLTVPGGGFLGAHVGLLKPKHAKADFGTPIDVQYSLKGSILTRAEFLRGELASIPIHISHFDPETGKRFSIILDSFC